MGAIDRLRTTTETGGAGRRATVARDRVAEQWYADGSEEVAIRRHCTMALLQRDIDEAARRAQCMARLELALRRDPDE